MSVIWITGLSGSGKTTLAEKLCAHLRGIGQQVVLLDGDELRSILSLSEDEPKFYNSDVRLGLAFKYAKLSKMISDNGVSVVVATISLFESIHEWNRKNIKDYFEVFLDVPMTELISRDPKKIYSRFFSGELKDVAGLDLAVDFPKNAHLKMSHTGDESLDEMLSNLLNVLERSKK